MANYYLNSNGSLTTKKTNKKKNYILQDDGTLINQAEQEKKAKEQNAFFKSGSSDVGTGLAASTGDFLLDMGQGFFRTLEGISDTLQYGLSDLTGAIGMKDASNWLKENAKFNSTGSLFGINENVEDNIFSKELRNDINEASYLGGMSDSIGEGLGNIGAMAALGAVGGQALGAAGVGVTETGVLTTGGKLLLSGGNSYLSAYGNARSEAYNNGASDDEANKYGIINGFAEALSEQFFDSMPGIKSAGFAEKIGIKDAIANGFSKGLGTNVGKLFLRLVGGLEEGSEEMISNALVAVGQDFMHQLDKNYTYGMDNLTGNVVEDFKKNFLSEDSIKSFISAGFTSAILGVGGDILTTAQTNQVVNAFAKDNNMSFKEAKALLGGQTLNEAQQQVQRESKNGNMEVNNVVELEDAAKKRIVNFMKSHRGENIESRIEDLVREEEKKQGITFTDEQRTLEANKIRATFVDETNNPDRYRTFTANKNETNNELIESFKKAKVNNTQQAHAMYNFVSKLQENNKNLKYQVVNNEILKEMGQDVEGATINGFNQDGTIYINMDAKNPYQAVAYHEIAHSIKDTSPELYNELKNLVFELKGKQGLEQYRKLYRVNDGELKSDLTENVEDEYINDKLGEILNDDKFINKIDNRNIIQKLIDEIKRVVKYMTSSKDQKQLMKVQKRLEEVYKQGYQEANFKEINKQKATQTINENKTPQIKQDENVNQNKSTTNVPILSKNLREYLELKEKYDKDNIKVEDRSKVIEQLNQLEDRLTPEEKNEVYKRESQNLNEGNRPSFSLSQDEINNTLSNNDIKTSNDIMFDEENMQYYKEHNQPSPEVLSKMTRLSDFIKEHRSDFDEIENRPRNVNSGYYFVDDNIVKLSTTLEGDKLYIDELYVEKQKQGAGTKVVNALKQYAKEHDLEIVPFKELSTAKGFWDKALNRNTKYSLSQDSQGKELTKEQQEYFKDSEVRDNEGRLLEVYHGTPNPGFTIFDTNKSGQNTSSGEYGLYFTDSKEFADDFSYERIETDSMFFDQKGKKGEVYPVYLNATNVLDFANLTEQEINDLYNYASNMGQLDGKEKFVENMLKWQQIGNHQLMKGNLDLKAIADNSNYDGIKAKLNVQGNENEYIVFNSNQIKNTDNTNPTENQDIRYSLSHDSQDRELSPQQQEYFKDSKARDDNGNLLTLYHNTDKDFNEFSPDYYGKNTGEKLRGIYLSPEPLGSYGDRSIEAYANITNPVTIESHNITYEQFKELLQGKMKENNIESGWRYLKNSNDLTILEKILDQYKRVKDYQNPQEFYDRVLQVTGYDGAMYSGNGAYANGRISYVAFNSNQVKNIDNTNPTSNPDIRYSLSQDSQGRELSQQQQEYFKNSKIRDDEGRLIPMYHGSNSEFTIFDRTKGSQSNSNAGVGFWFTASSEGAKNFADSVWYGDKKPTLFETYLNITNPKIYESYDNTEARNNLKEQLNTLYNQRKTLTDEYSWESPSLSNVVSYMSYMDDEKLLDGLVNTFKLKQDKAQKYIEDAKKYVQLNDQYKQIEKQFDDARWTDSYEQFRTDIYRLAGKSADDANIGGTGVALDNKEQYLEQYVNSLKEQGYDGIIIKDTQYDSNTMGGVNTQYVAFDSNQIKNVDNLNPTDNPDIRYSLSVEQANTGTDNNGNSLTNGQKEYFKNSKVTDENGNLIELYHTTTEKAAQFNEFNPVGSQGYRYGNQVVNFFTDSKEMSGSYADQDYKMANTKPIKNMSDVNDVLNEFNSQGFNEFKVEEKNGKYVLTDNYNNNVINKYNELTADLTDGQKEFLNNFLKSPKVDIIYYYTDYIKDTGLDEALKQSKELDLTQETLNKFNNIKKELDDSYLNRKKIGGGGFVGYDVDNVQPGLDLIKNYIDGQTIESNDIYTFNSKEELYDNLINTIENNVDRFKTNLQYEGYANITNPYIVDAKGTQWDAIEVDNIQKLKNDIKEKWDIPERQLDRLEGNTLDELNRDLTKLGYQLTTDEYGDLGLFTKNGQLAIDMVNVNDVMQEIRTDLDNDLNTPISTNDIVFQALAENKMGANYDGVIIKNTIDYGGAAENIDIPHNIYVTFNSNQFKAADNVSPTQDADIRYSLGDYRGSHQIENSQSITDLDINDIKNKVIDLNGYLTRQDQTDLSKLKKILNNPEEKVKIYRASPVNELNNGDWVTTDKSYAQNVANNNGGKVYTYEVNANELYYPDNVSELPSLHRLSSFQYNGIDYSLSNVEQESANNVLKVIESYDDYLKTLPSYQQLQERTRLGNYTDETHGILTKEDYKNKKIDLFNKQIEKADNRMEEQAKRFARENLELTRKSREQLQTIIDKYKGQSRESIFNSTAKDEIREFVKNNSRQEFVEEVIDEQTRDLQRAIRNTELVISKDSAGEFADGITQFKKNNPGLKIKYGRQNIDSVYQELQEQYPGMLEDDVADKDIPFVLADVLKKSYRHFDNSNVHVFELNDKEIDSISNKIYRGLTNNAISDEQLQNMVSEISKKVEEKYARGMAAEKYREIARNTIDVTDITDKKRGIQYKINTMKRNLRDIMSKEQAQLWYDTYFKPITIHNAQSEIDKQSYVERIQKYNLNNDESTYTQMLGELKYNPETKLTSEQVNNFAATHRVDIQKCTEAVEEFRNVYDELIERVNESLKANGYKPIDYRKGYFPHFIEDKPNSIIGKFAEKFGWNIQKGTLPTDIAGLTDGFKPGKAWTSFSQKRTGDTTDYNALKGMDNYLRGAMDLIYHTEDIQKLRALENEIRYQYSSEGVQKQIDEIYANQDLSPEEKSQQIALLTDNVRDNPLGNLVTELRDYTNNLANKKSILDRGMEQALGRDMFSIMNNINGRVSANMVGANLSSAMTNFIPITQAWSQVSTKNLMRGMYESIRNTFNNDGFDQNSVYLTNRTQQAENLYMSGLDRVNQKLGLLFEGVDSFTSNTIVRAKYYENLENGMSEQAAMENADEFAKDVMAGRSKGDSPTIFNSKNPLYKMFTAFQLEVNNQYGYMFKDLPADLGDEAKDKLAMAFMKMFIGAWLYNMFSEKITGRKAAFSPIDMIQDEYKIATSDLDFSKKVENIASDVAQEAPFIGGIMGGGRLPIQGAIPYENPLSMVLSTAEDLGKAMGDDEGKKKTAINNLKKEWLKPVYYLALPFAGGQIKKVNEGLAMYDKNLPIKGSYTAAGKLRFEADTSPLGMLQAAVFGQYAGENAREYFDKGYTPLSEKQINEALDANLPIAEYREVNKGIAEAKKTAKENGDSQTEAQYDYIYNLPISMEQKNSLINSKLGTSDEVTDDNGYVKYTDGKKTYWYDSENDIVYNNKYKEMPNINIDELTQYSNVKDLSNYGDYGSLAEFNYANENPSKYQTITAITDYDSFMDYRDEITAIKDRYETTSERKSAVFNYINGLSLNKYQKLMLQKMAAGYSIKSYKNEMRNYIESLSLTAEEKQQIDNELFS